MNKLSVALLTVSCLIQVAHADPVIQAVSPNVGPAKGGQRVTLIGKGFLKGAQVRFEWNDCRVLSVRSTEIECFTSRDTSGLMRPRISVRNSNGGYAEIRDAYTYIDGEH